MKRELNTVEMKEANGGFFFLLLAAAAIASAVAWAGIEEGYEASNGQSLADTAEEEDDS